jgi:hypothetical protein
VSFAGRRRFGPIAASLATSATGALLISLLIPNCLLVHG